MSQITSSREEADRIDEIVQAFLDGDNELQSILEDRFYADTDYTGVERLIDALQDARRQVLLGDGPNELFTGVIGEDGTYFVRVSGPIGAEEGAEWLQRDMGLTDVQYVLTLEPSPQARLKSPEGFSWGYGGSGPSACALSILYRVFGHEEILMPYFSDFKYEILNRLDAFQGNTGEQQVGIRWRLTSDQVREWMRMKVAA